MLSHSVPTSDTYSDTPGSAALAAASGRGMNGHQMHTRDSSPDSDDDDYEHGFDPSLTATPGLYDPYAVPMYTPNLTHAPFTYPGQPYEVDVKTERQMFINDVPTRRDSTISTFSTFVPPPPHAMLPSYTGDDWSHLHSHQIPPDVYADAVKHEDWSNEEGFDPVFFDFTHHTPVLQQGPLEAPEVPVQHSAMVPMEEHDQELFEYLLSNVLRLLFPILEANQHGSVQGSVIIPALETNQAYLHSCLHAAGLHKRANLAHHDGSTMLSSGEALDHAIQRHKFSCISEVVSSLNNDVQTHATLEATLQMIALSTVVGHSAEADRPEKDIPWHSHFQAATALVSKLNLPNLLEDMIHAGGQPPFNMTLAAWIDILGSTMQGKSPTFANTSISMEAQAVWQSSWVVTTE
jgi:C6 transcription factor Pro1